MPPDPLQSFEWHYFFQASFNHLQSVSLFTAFLLSSCSSGSSALLACRFHFSLFASLFRSRWGNTTHLRSCSAPSSPPFLLCSVCHGIGSYFLSLFFSIAPLAHICLCVDQLTTHTVTLTLAP